MTRRLLYALFDLHPVGLTAATLLMASVILTVLVGNIGFQGDDWWILSFPYWNPFPQSLVEYARAARRPVEGLYWISIFEIFGIDRPPYFLLSLLLNVLSSSLLAFCLLRLYPENTRLALWGALFSFFMPMTSHLVYVMHTDNSRLAMVFFWASVLSMQSGVLGSRKNLIFAVLWYFLSVLTYENASLLIFAMPLFVVPLARDVRKSTPKRVIAKRVVLAVAFGFLGFIGIRFLLFSGGAVNHANLVPPTELLLSYAETLLLYFWAPFHPVASDFYSWAFGMITGGATFVLLSPRDHSSPLSVCFQGKNNFQMVFMFVVGCIVFVLGIAPYLVAGYSASFGFTSQSRIYSSGSFGVAIALAAVFSLDVSSRSLGRAMNLLGIFLVTVMATLFCDLRTDWREAAVIRKDLCTSLQTNAPDVSDGTTLLFLDLQAYIGNRAVIFQGVDGLHEYVKMLYNNNTVNGFFLYSRDADNPIESERTAIMTPEGIRARGSAPWGLSPLNTIIIFQSQGRKLSLLESLSDTETSLDAKWIGIAKISSQTQRIFPAGEEHKTRHECLY